MIRLGLFGANGRMGARVRACAPRHAGLSLDALVTRDGVEGIELGACDVVIDVSVAPATDALLRALDGSSAALVTGVTGRTPEQRAAVLGRASTAAVFEAANFSVGVAVLTRLVAEAARAMGPTAEVEVFELHHHGKADAPSGTALKLARAAAEGQGLGWPHARAAVRDGVTGPRAPGQVGIAALRGGEVPGEHTVYLFGEEERLELVHRAADRNVFAHGALRAAAWVAGRPPGAYGMADLIGNEGESPRV